MGNNCCADVTSDLDKPGEKAKALEFRQFCDAETAFTRETVDDEAVNEAEERYREKLIEDQKQIELSLLAAEEAEQKRDNQIAVNKEKEEKKRRMKQRIKDLETKRKEDDSKERIRKEAERVAEVISEEI